MSEKTKFVGIMDVEGWTKIIANISDSVDLPKFEQLIHDLEQKIEHQLDEKKGDFDSEIDASINLLEFQKAMYQQMEFAHS